MKHSLTDLPRGKLEEARLKCWKEKLDHPNRTPGKVLQAYLDNLDFSIDELDQQMCWDCWPLDDDVEEFYFSHVRDWGSRGDDSPLSL